ncbi:MAG: hypothetical protein ABJA77_14900 [Variovorax sp.]
MPLRRDGEALNALLKRLDRAVGAYYDDGETVDEVNGPRSEREDARRLQSARSGHPKSPLNCVS